MLTNDSSRNKFIFNIILLFKKKINKVLYMLKELRDLLMKIVNDIDSGNSNIDKSQTIEIASAIGELILLLLYSRVRCYRIKNMQK